MRRASTILFWLCAGAVALLSSCTVIVGVGDYKSGDAGANETDGGGTTDRSVGDAGEAAAACGSVLPPSSVLQPLIRGCVMATGCDPYVPTFTVGWCVSVGGIGGFLGQACLAGATSCADYTACTGLSYPPSAADCPSGTEFTCNSANNQYIDCRHDAGTPDGLVLDCSKLNATCKITGTQPNTVVGCAVLPSCSDPATNLHCSGNKLYRCINGVGYGQDCTTQSATCQTETDGGGGCFYNAPPCASSGVSCDGTTAVICTADSQKVTYDCSKLGFQCLLSSDGGSVGCAASGCSFSDLENCTESCSTDGNTATFCIGGVPTSVDCTMFPGLTHCGTGPVQCVP